MRIVLVGPPASGKGTQAGRIVDRFGGVHIATGDILRSNAERRTELGRTASRYMDRGDLVPDEVIIGMVLERMGEGDCAGGFVLDGFPRTVPQAEALEGRLEELGCPLDAVVSLAVGEEELRRRLAGRAREEHRSDDTEETVRHRLEVFAAQTRPLVDYYQRRGILVRINAVGPVDAISEQIFATLHWHKARTMAAGVNQPEWALDAAGSS